LTGVPAYQALRTPRHEILRVRGLDIQLTRWGPEPGPVAPVFLLHGWQDSADTFQFMVDAFVHDWPLVALDWRGFGGSEWSGNGYWFPDYIADLEALLDLLSPGEPARIVGHSMGGNIAATYAGLRPERVRCVVNLEGFGMERTSSEQAPAQLRKWLDQVKVAPVTKDYESFEQFAAVIAFRYPRFSAAQADFVARAWGRLEPSGRVSLSGDARHRWINPALYKREDAEQVWRQITAPMLLVLGDQSEYLPRLGADGTEAALRAIYPGVEIAHVPGGGHMLHIEQPDLVAALAEQFLSTH
jgi:pimeloyl-ACP methyl ester carboxylesterase